MKTLATALFLTVAVACHAQDRPDPATIQAAQREAMASLAFMDGVWRGPASTTLASADKHDITQTERIGPLLGGTVKVIEGRGYEPDGKVTFNALGVVAFDAEKKAYNFRSYALGRFGDFKFDATGDGYTWEISTPAFTIRYVATIAGDKFREVGDRIVPGQPPMRIFEMDLVRVSDTDWPLGTPVPQK